MIGNHIENGKYVLTEEGDETGFLTLHHSSVGWVASYGSAPYVKLRNGSVAMVSADNLPDALQGLYDWCKANNILD